MSCRGLISLCVGLLLALSAQWAMAQDDDRIPRLERSVRELRSELKVVRSGLKTAEITAAVRSEALEHATTALDTRLQQLADSQKNLGINLGQYHDQTAYLSYGLLGLGLLQLIMVWAYRGKHAAEKPEIFNQPVIDSAEKQEFSSERSLANGGGDETIAGSEPSYKATAVPEASYWPEPDLAAAEATEQHVKTGYIDKTPMPTMGPPPSFWSAEELNAVKVVQQASVANFMRPPADIA